MGRREAQRQTLVIDAYNVLHRLRDRSPEGRVEARNWFESLIRRWRSARRSAPRVVLVYDGSADGTRSLEERARGFEVRYAGTSATADDVILAIARRARPEDGITVITSDHYDIVRNLGGLPVRHRRAEEFAGELLEIDEAPPRAASEKPDGVSGSDVTSWVKEFGFRRDRRRR